MEFLIIKMPQRRAVRKFQKREIQDEIINSIYRGQRRRY